MSRNYLIKRLLQTIPILFGITVLAFALMCIASGDAVSMIAENAGMTVSPQVLEQRRRELGLDQPFVVQYLNWLKGALSGDLGVSYVSGRPVLELLGQKLPETVRLTLASMVLTICLSLPLGVLAAVKRNRFTDYLIRIFAFIGNSMPGFFVSLILLLVFAVRIPLFPVMGSNSGIRGMILPVVTLTIAMSAKYIRQIRALVLEEFNKDYVMGARARGVSERQIITGSILRVSLPAIVTLIALSAGSLLGGAAIVETIFMWDGVGRMAVEAAAMRDYPVIQAYVVWMAVIYVMINLIADIVCHYLDPRSLAEQEAGS